MFLKYTTYFALALFLCACTYQPGQRISSPTQCLAHFFGISSNSTLSDCEDLNQYQIDTTVFSSDPKTKTETHLSQECLFVKDVEWCLPVRIDSFNTTEALKYDLENFEAYNYQEYRVHLKNFQGEALLSVTAKTLSEAIQAASAKCEQRAQ